MEREVSLEHMRVKASFKFISALLYIQLNLPPFPCLLCALGQNIAAHFKTLWTVGLRTLEEQLCQSCKLFFNYPFLRRPTWFTSSKHVISVNEM